MKKPNFDFSKEGIQRFFLYHTEKVVLGIAVLLTGLLFWFGFSTPVFTKKEPAQLSSMADAAQTYIAKDDAWERLAEKRQADDTVHVRIQNANELVNLDKLLPQYTDGVLTGIPTRSLKKRTDPKVIAPTDLRVRTAKASILFSSGANLLAGLPSEATAAALPGREGRGDQDRDEDAGIGVAVPEFVKKVADGVRPDTGAEPKGLADFYVNVVTAVIDMDAQWKEFAPLQDSMGYYPPRDKPNFRFVEIQRRVDGGDWVDVTEKVSKFNKIYAGNFPVMTYPQNSGGPNEVEVTKQFSAPEMMAPEHYNPVTCAPIPSFTNFDYRSFVVHPTDQVAFREIATRAEISQETEEAAELLDQGDTFNPFRDGDGAEAPQPDGRRGAGGRDRGRGDAGRGAGGQSVGGGRGGTPQVAMTNSYSDYIAVANAVKQQTNYKMVRVFDLLEPTEANKQYEYRIRVWLDDPNNEPPKSMVAQTKRGRGREGDNLSAGGGAGGAAERADGGSVPAGGDQGDGGMDTGPDLDSFTYVAANDSMKSDEVRRRIKEAREKKLPEDRAFLKYAFHAKENDGWTEATKPIVPNKNTPTGYVYTGNVVAPRKFRTDRGEFDIYERTANLAVAAWDVEIDGQPKRLGVAVPATKSEARASDVLNLQTDTYVLDPTDWGIRKAENALIRSSNMVVDIMGGDEIKDLNPRTSASAAYSMSFDMPGEVLVFDLATQSFRVQRDLEDKGDYLKSKFEDDEVAAFGGKRQRESETSEERGDRDDRGGRGGRGGDPFGDG